MEVSWTTADELEFIRTIGTHNELSLRVPRKVWLERYVSAVTLRRRWGNLNGDRIVAFAIDELAKCSTNGAGSEEKG